MYSKNSVLLPLDAASTALPAMESATAWTMEENGRHLKEKGARVESLFSLYFLLPLLYLFVMLSMHGFLAILY